MLGGWNEKGRRYVTAHRVQVQPHARHTTDWRCGGGHIPRFFKLTIFQSECIPGERRGRLPVVPDVVED